MLQLGLDKLPTYGVMSGTDRALIRAYIDYLVERGYLRLDGAEYPVLRTTPQARQVLFQGSRSAIPSAGRTSSSPLPGPKKLPAPLPSSRRIRASLRRCGSCAPGWPWRRMCPLTLSFPMPH